MMDALLKNKTSSWQSELGPEKEKPYFQALMSFLKEERKNKAIYPSEKDLFNALKYTPLDKVKVVIIGQDPYHGPDQAHGLCFSVLPGIKPPPSLKNIYLELKNDLGIPLSQDGCLIKWAKQGVLLLNAVLSVESGKPQSHANKGWEQFTDKIIQILNDKKEHVVFLLWGAYAQKKGEKINPAKHYILKAAHPSPFSVRGFLSCRHFSKVNAWLKAHNQDPIDWSVGEI